jgi:hypothetical protein
MAGRKSPRETADEKAARLLVTGRVRVAAVGNWHVVATVQGDHATYVTGYEDGRWHCSCPNLLRCSHVTALRLVTDPTPTLASAS